MENENEITERIIGAAIEVHRHPGAGLLESAYEECLCYELKQIGLRFERQVYLPIQYKELRLESAYRMDLPVEDSVVVEIKALEDVAPVHASQVLTVSKKRVGLLIHFNVAVLKDGIQPVVNHYAGKPIGSAPRVSPRLRVSASIPQPQESR